MEFNKIKKVYMTDGLKCSVDTLLLYYYKMWYNRTQSREVLLGWGMYCTIATYELYLDGMVFFNNLWSFWKVYDKSYSFQ